MKYEWYDEFNFVRDYLVFRMVGIGVKLFSFDYNWDMFWYLKVVMNEGQVFYVGLVWYCYGGSVGVMGEMYVMYFGKDIYFMECSGMFVNVNFGDNVKWNMQNFFIGGIKNWVKMVLLWSLVQDLCGNFYIGGCVDCCGVILID